VVERGKFILETPRVMLRELTPDDAPSFFRLNSHREVMRYTCEPLWESVEGTREAMRSYEDYRVHGYGRWGCIDKKDGRLLGFNGLKFLPELGETDIGYRFFPECWGQGLATETSLAVIEFGFETLELTKIVALVLPENAASVRVLEKLGMSRVEISRDEEGREVQRHELTREGWRSRRGGTI
jgi:RimJ/RimL family protein N-acetyltransferase